MNSCLQIEFDKSFESLYLIHYNYIMCVDMYEIYISSYESISVIPLILARAG